jgi:hypothetical protein
MLLHFKVIRKLALIFYVALNLAYHGMQIEFYRQGYNYEAIRVIEIALLFIMFVDLVIVEFVLLKLVRKNFYFFENFLKIFFKNKLFF